MKTVLFCVAPDPRLLRKRRRASAKHFDKHFHVDLIAADVRLRCQFHPALVLEKRRLPTCLAGRYLNVNERILKQWCSRE